MRFTLPATERLKLRKQIETLFRQGEAFSVFPVRVMYTTSPRDKDASLYRAGFSVPKKKMKLAVQRNRIKRLIREAWRLQKHLLQSLLENKEIQLHVFFIFTGKEIPDFPTTQKCMKKAIALLQTKLSPQDVPTS
ncbi:ribonuclease P protein component [Taibaiella sp. KBW10]|nr:ribonuclease P protein component [Taibaiella sp. KBW10]